MSNSELSISILELCSTYKVEYYAATPYTLGEMSWQADNRQFTKQRALQEVAKIESMGFKTRISVVG